MSIVVTGGAGFIGSCMVRTLNNHGLEDIIIIDNIALSDKWMNLRNKKYLRYIHKSIVKPDSIEEALGLEPDEEVEAVIHMGACSSTTERNFDYLYNNNFEYTKMLWNYCTEKHIPFLYASSAATYGNGEDGFDDKADIEKLQPLNGYGYSKQLFDLWVKKQLLEKKEMPEHWVGFKFFNVYGPNEYCKGSMASMIYHGYRQIKETGVIRLFKSCNPDYQDGEQLRDFVYVKDVCNVMWQFLDGKCRANGIYNVGTGRAQSFRELAEATFHALQIEPNIEYIDMPEQLREKYQYYTKADIAKLRTAGYLESFCDLEQGASDYVQNYLDKNFTIY